MISAKIVADSISTEKIRLTSFELRYPKFIHGELMTHRVFSRNTRSSRAVPVKKILHELRTSPVEPIVWMKNQAGMQSAEFLDEEDRIHARNIWLSMADDVARYCERLQELNLHKQWANRPTEAFVDNIAIVTSCFWKNFYGLRIHSAAQPEIKALAEAMYEAHRNSVPKLIIPDAQPEFGEVAWHLPYIDADTFSMLCGTQGEPNYVVLCKISAARCARVSYRTFDNKIPTIEEDLELFDKLMGQQPLHASPAEHQATPDTFIGYRWKNENLHGNFHGWNQFRKMLDGESGNMFKCDIDYVL